MEKDEIFMLEAIKEAKKAELIDEVPIGCIIVKDGKILSRAYNKREKNSDVTGHAEIIAIRKAEKKLNDWQLNDCELYVTIEPCVMCAGAIYQARIKRVIYGAKDLKAGAIDSAIHLFDEKFLNHHPKVTSGVFSDTCSSLMSNYFKKKRK